MNTRSLAAGEGAIDGDTIPCPHCGYGNPRPRVQMMDSVSSLLCRRCQRTFPIDEDEGQDG